MKRTVQLAWAILALAVGAGCGSGGPSKTSIEKYCAFDQSCGNPTFRSAGQCAYGVELLLAAGPQFPGEYNRVISCADSSSTCDAVQLCVSRNHGPSYCSSHHGASCDGNVLVNCPTFTSGYGSAIDCNDYNLTCITANGSATCTNNNTCTSGSADRCSGNHLITCDDSTHYEVELDCNQVDPGSQCGVVNGRAQCQRQAAACAQQDPYCDGNYLVQCADDNRERRVDCKSAIEGSCRIVGGAAQCVADANECGSADDDRCSGDSLQLCVNGRYESVNCTALGYQHCTPRTGFGAHGVECTN